MDTFAYMAINNHHCYSKCFNPKVSQSPLPTTLGVLNKCARTEGHEISLNQNIRYVK